jgi:hypothetical protein
MEELPEEMEDALQRMVRLGLIEEVGDGFRFIPPPIPQKSNS